MRRETIIKREEEKKNEVGVTGVCQTKKEKKGKKSKKNRKKEDKVQPLSEG